MPSVFLSYSREDLPVIEQLAARLRTASPEISLWRDQEKIYGGQNWPKILGEAIADQEVFLLAWSRHSAISHFVELEWNTAIALKKTIILCLLDKTPLAPPLRAFHGYRLDDVTVLITSLRGLPRGDVQRREPVIHKLNDITATDGITVLAQAKAIFTQQQWILRGAVPQTGGDISSHDVPTQSNQHRRVLGRWEKRVAIVAGILTVIWTGIQIIDKFWHPPTPSVEGTHGSTNEHSALERVEQFGMITAALSNFWADMNMSPVPFEKLDRELHAMAQRDRELQASLARWSSSEAEVEELFHKAQQAAKDLEYSKAEHLLDQAIQRDKHVAYELQEIATARLTLAAAKLVANGDVQAKQRDLVKAQDYYQNALKLLPLSDTEHRNAYRMKLGAVLRQASRGAAGPDIQKFFDEAVQTYHAAMTDFVKESPEWAEANFELCKTLVDRAEFVSDEFSMKLLTDAVGACKLALTVYTKAQFPDKWFFVTGKLATATTQLGLKLPLKSEDHLQLNAESKTLLEEWQSVGRDAQFIKSIVANALKNSANQHSFGDSREISPLAMDAVTAWLMAEFSSETGDQRSVLFDKSVMAWESMLTVFPMTQFPKEATGIIVMIGNLRTDQAEYDTEEEARQRHRKQAIAAFEDGLKIFTVDQIPHFYVALKLLIGHTSYELGTQVHDAEGTEFLKKAKDSLRAALTVTPTRLLPREAAACQTMLGAVLVEEGTRTTSKERTIFLREAVQAYKEALKIITPESLPKLWRGLLGELAKSSELLEDWQGVVDSNRTVLTVYPDDRDALERARFSYHEKLFAYPAAFDLLKQWATRHPENLFAQVNFVEAHLTTGRYREAERRLVELLRKTPSLDPRASLGLRMLEMTNLLALKKPSAIPQKLKALRTFVVDQPESFHANWIFDGTEHYVQTEQVFAPYRSWLMDLFNVVKSKDRAALLAALDRLQASFKP